MRRVLVVGLFALLVTAGVVAQQQYLAFEAITVANTAIGFTSATIVAGSGHPQAEQATCRLETAQVRFRIDGTAPTASVGTILEVGDVLVVKGADVLKRFKAIRTGGTSGSLTCHYATPGDR